MLRRLESQCTGGSDGARESEEVKVNSGTIAAVMAAVCTVSAVT